MFFMRKKCLILFLLAYVRLASAQTTTISGYVKEAETGESIAAATVMLEGSNKAVMTNKYGFYSISFQAQNNAVLVARCLGFQEKKEILAGATTLDFLLQSQSKELDEVMVTAPKYQKLSSTEQMSQIAISTRQIKEIPALLGEKDVLKVLQLLPGVQKGSEGNVGLYVRGGSADQNLLILDDAVVYNANHLFGFFSVFNGDAIKNTTLTKGGFPARYGGRLSSVVEMQMKEGNKYKTEGEVGIGLLSSRLTLGGPLKKGVASYLIAARRTYSDLIIGLASDNSPSIYFYDLNAKVNYDFGHKNKLFLSGYFGKDVFSFDALDYQNIKESDGFKWGNSTATLRWNHVFGAKVFANTSLLFTNYHFKVYNEEKNDITQKVFTKDFSSQITDIGLKSDFDINWHDKHSLKSGFQWVSHTFSPNAYVYENQYLDSLQVVENKTTGIESNFYAEDTWKPNSKLSLNMGFRLALFGLQAKTFFFVEPRMSVNYKLNEHSSLKASYSVMNQYLHLLSNSGIGLPTDLWVPSTEKIAPQHAKQWALGYANDLEKHHLNFTAELYYKKLENIIAYKDGASFQLLNVKPNAERISQVDWQENVTSGKGESYGLELFLQKQTGKLNGWVGYTLSWTKYQFAELNDGKFFYPRQDRRHDLSIVGIYKITPKINFSATWIYGSGAFMRIPVANYTLRAFSSQSTNGLYSEDRRTVTRYTQRDEFRAAPYHRLDLACQFHKTKKKNKVRTWEIGIYNAYNRVNPFYYEYGIKGFEGMYPPSDTKEKLLRKGIAPIVPSITYQLKF